MKLHQHNSIPSYVDPESLKEGCVLCARNRIEELEAKFQATGFVPLGVIGLLADIIIGLEARVRYVER